MMRIAAFVVLTALTIPPGSAQVSEQLSVELVEVPPTYGVDLDGGTVGQAGADLLFEAITSSELYLTPRNSAQFAPGDFSKRDFAGCASAAYATGKISLRDARPGAYICVKTSDGRVGSVKIETLSPGAVHVLALSYVVWE